MDRPDTWLTLQEVSNITGKSLDSLRKMIKRGKFVQAKKIDSERGKQWVIHISEVEQITGQDRTNFHSGQTDWTQTGQINVISLEHYDKQREKWEEEKAGLVQGMLMYRFKFEELDRKLKLLPAPPEVITQEFEKVKSELEDKEQALHDTKGELHQVNQALHKLESERQHLELSLQAKQEAHSGLLSEREALSHQIDKAKELQGILQGQRAKLEEELQSIRRESQKEREELSHQLEQAKNELTTRNTQAEERAEQLDRERKILEERLKQKEEQRRRLSEELEQEKGRAWWKKLFNLK